MMSGTSIHGILFQTHTHGANLYIRHCSHCLGPIMIFRVYENVLISFQKRRKEWTFRLKKKSGYIILMSFSLCQHSHKVYCWTFSMEGGAIKVTIWPSSHKPGRADCRIESWGSESWLPMSQFPHAQQRVPAPLLRAMNFKNQWPLLLVFPWIW